MRELKFRAFIDGEMVILPFATFQYLESATKRKCKGAPIMQFTGLKDKKGVDIYEDDIVQFVISEAIDYDAEYDYEKYGSNPQIAVFRWSDEACGFRMNFSSRFKIRPEMIEVVGNIHEHPHLVTPAERTA